jgi:hypothetical protein
MLAQKNNSTNEFYHRDSPFVQLPREILFLIIRKVAGIVAIEGWSICQPNTISTIHGAIEGADREGFPFPRSNVLMFIVEFDLGSEKLRPGPLHCGMHIGYLLFLFYPGFLQGGFSGPGSLAYNSNVNMGWTPAQGKLHKWRVLIRRLGVCHVTIVDADDKNRKFDYEWNGSYETLFDRNLSIRPSGNNYVTSSHLKVWFQ